jgi:structural maintenance of chromosome 3 (chondroitin sulfate proteoglycan 6)
LDERKNLAITQTFKQVAQHFKEIWSEIVPEGLGELVMIERNQEEFSQSQSNETVERYTGISLNVSFSAGKLQSLQQLSGGQKSLVALTLIFAIQKCDPAPFYLFDEIDAALDAQYRTKVAGKAFFNPEMITKQKENAQFITTTFRKELLKDADAFYGVTFVNKVSKIQSIDRESAQEFVVSQAGET